MQINKNTDESILVIEPVGGIGLYNLGLLRTFLHQVREDGNLKIIIDLGKVTSIDSSTIGFFIHETATLTADGGVLKLASLSASVRKSLTITETLSQLNVYDDLASAKASFKKSSS